MCLYLRIDRQHGLPGHSDTFTSAVTKLELCTLHWHHWDFEDMHPRRVKTGLDDAAQASSRSPG